MAYGAEGEAMTEARGGAMAAGSGGARAPRTAPGAGPEGGGEIPLITVQEVGSSSLPGRAKLFSMLACNG